MDPGFWKGEPLMLTTRHQCLIRWRGFDYDKGGIGPGVAERWELASDGSAWTFFLRSGLKWHNGDPSTATRRQV